MTYPPEDAFQIAPYTLEFDNRMSAHEAGHATLGRSLGLRIDGVYARVMSVSPNGRPRVVYLTKPDAASWAESDPERKVLLLAGGAAGEVLLMGGWTDAQVTIDRHDLKELGVVNFEYCAEYAVRLLKENERLFVAVRDKILAGMSGLQHRNLTLDRPDVMLVTGSEIEGLFLEMGSQVNPVGFTLQAACMPTNSHDS
jgi:hypothetical protein